MGAWGYRPFENDDALDWLHETAFKPIRAGLRRSVSGQRAEEGFFIRRAAAQLLISIHNCGVSVPEEDFDLAVEKIEGILDCNMSSWVDPKACERSVLDQLRELARIRNTLRRRRR